MDKFSWYTDPVKVTDCLTVYQYAVDREILIEKRKDGSRSFILVKKGTYVTMQDGGWQRYKPNLKGGHTHNHVKNAHKRMEKRMHKCHSCGELFPKGIKHFVCNSCVEEEKIKAALDMYEKFNGIIRNQ